MASVKGFECPNRFRVYSDLTAVFLKQEVDSKFELIDMEGFGEIVVGAGTERDHFTIFIIERCNNDDGGAYEVHVRP